MAALMAWAFSLLSSLGVVEDPPTVEPLELSADALQPADVAASRTPTDRPIDIYNGF